MNGLPIGSERKVIVLYVIVIVELSSYVIRWPFKLRHGNILRRVPQYFSPLCTQIRIRQVLVQCNPRVSNNPNCHAYNHWRCIETIEISLRGDKMSTPSLCELDDTVHRTHYNCTVRDDDCGNVQPELAGPRKRRMNSQCAATATSTVPQ
jgi:hypothetical protein